MSACKSQIYPDHPQFRIDFLRWLEMLEIMCSPETKNPPASVSAADARRFPHHTNTQEISDDQEVVSRGA